MKLKTLFFSALLALTLSAPALAATDYVELLDRAYQNYIDASIGFHPQDAQDKINAAFVALRRQGREFSFFSKCTRHFQRMPNLTQITFV